MCSKKKKKGLVKLKDKFFPTHEMGKDPVSQAGRRPPFWRAGAVSVSNLNRCRRRDHTPHCSGSVLRSSGWGPGCRELLAGRAEGHHPRAGADAEEGPGGWRKDTHDSLSRG